MLMIECNKDGRKILIPFIEDGEISAKGRASIEEEVIILRGYVMPHSEAVALLSKADGVSIGPFTGFDVGVIDNA
ncbi:MAG TPA: hypothetical protein VIM69_10565 [Opitutaceae bacterium]